MAPMTTAEEAAAVSGQPVTLEDDLLTVAGSHGTRIDRVDMLRKMNKKPTRVGIMLRLAQADASFEWLNNLVLQKQFGELNHAHRSSTALPRA